MGGSDVLSGMNVVPCGIFQPPGLWKKTKSSLALYTELWGLSLTYHFGRESSLWISFLLVSVCV